jgi:sugar lactone lactonase YvrE
MTDMRNQRIRIIPPDHIITTYGGDGTQGFAGDGGPVGSAIFNFPTEATPRPGAGLALDEDTLYIADTLNNRIRTVDLATGIINTIAGTGEGGYSGDGGPALEAQLFTPIDIEVVGRTLYIADTDNSRIRIMDLDTGIIDTFSGTGESTWTGDGGPAKEASLNFPHGIGIADDGRVFIADTYNHVIRVVYP